MSFEKDHNRMKNPQAPNVFRPRRRGRPLRLRGHVRHGGLRRPLHPRGHDLGRRRLAGHPAERVRREARDQGGVPLPEEGAPRVRHKVGHQLAVLNKSGHHAQ